MEKEQSGRQGAAIEAPQVAGVEYLVDMGSGLVFARVDVKIIREQDKNARIQPTEMMRQLTENISRRRQLESCPLCVLADGRVEIISGHHRIRAAKEAGLEKIYVLLDVSGLSRSQIAAKQIAHNAIDGFDDKDVLREIAKLVTDVDDMIESYGGKELFAEPQLTIESLLSPKTDFDWKTVEFAFLPFQVSDMDALAERLRGKDYVGVAPQEKYDEFAQTLERYKGFQNVKNIGQAIYMMIVAAKEKMDAAGFDPTQEYVPITRVIGTGAIPVAEAEEIKAAIDRMEKAGTIPPKQRWRGLVEAIRNYLPTE